MAEGWIKINRTLFSHKVWLKSSLQTKVVMVALLGHAAYKPMQWIVRGKTFELQPGQLVTSWNRIMKWCGEGITRQGIRSSLDRLEKMEFITQRKTPSGTLITIVNWGKYQVSGDESVYNPIYNPVYNPVYNPALTTQKAREIGQFQGLKNEEQPNLQPSVQPSVQPSIKKEGIKKESNKRRREKEEIGGAEVSSNIADAFRSLTGSFNIQDEIRLWDLVKIHGEERVGEAIQIAKERNIRRLSYVKGILQSWQRDGYKKPKQKKEDPIPEGMKGKDDFDVWGDIPAHLRK